MGHFVASITYRGKRQLAILHLDLGCPWFFNRQSLAPAEPPPGQVIANPLSKGRSAPVTCLASSLAR